MKFYAVNIGAIYLTDTGLAGGDECKLEISNVEDLLTTVAGVAIPSITSTPVFQTMPWTGSKQFDVRVNVLNEAQWNDLKDLINDAQENSTPFIVAGTGDIGNFSVTVKPFPNKPFSAQRFKNERIYGVVLRFITV